jgi:hypothetical protein
MLLSSYAPKASDLASWWACECFSKGPFPVRCGPIFGAGQCPGRWPLRSSQAAGPVCETAKGMKSRLGSMNPVHLAA